MSKIKEIFGKTANELARNAIEKAFKEHQKLFMIRIKEMAERGEFYATFSICDYMEDWERLSEWLRSLGFHVTRPVNGSVVWIKWDDNSIIKKAMTTESKSSTVERYGLTPTGVSYAWELDSQSYDYVCFHCKKHSEYKTKYCPNCGAKMIID